MNKPTITAGAHRQKKFGLDNQIKIRDTNTHLFLLGKENLVKK
jgi:hypothetical protein